MVATKLGRGDESQIAQRIEGVVGDGHRVDFHRNRMGVARVAVTFLLVREICGLEFAISA
jgi:hypothetical protein